MEPGHQAFVVIQCLQGMHAALKTDIQMQISLVGHMLLQDRESQVMTGANRQQLRALIAGIGQNASEVHPQSLDVRLHPRARPSLRPEESFSKARGPRPLSLRPCDEGLPQYSFPLSERTPDRAIGEPQVRGRVPDRASFDYRTQQLKKRVVQTRAVLVLSLI